MMIFPSLPALCRPQPRFVRVALLFFTLLAGFSLTACGDGPAPTPADVEQALKSGWEKELGNYQPKVTLTLNSVQFAKPHAPTLQQTQVENIPADSTITPAIVDFTVRTFYDRETQAVRRVRDASVYKDQFGRWTVMTGSPQSEDKTVMEPAGK